MGGRKDRGKKGGLRNIVLSGKAGDGNDVSEMSFQITESPCWAKAVLGSSPSVPSVPSKR